MDESTSVETCGADIPKKTSSEFNILLTAKNVLSKKDSSNKDRTTSKPIVTSNINTPR
jgi:hypothetical protein